MRHQSLIGMGLLVSLISCGPRSGRAVDVSPTAPNWKRTCLVLSVGGPDGLAHLGALAAIKEAGVQIDCVVGNSMGSLVGALYVTAPLENTAERYTKFISSYTAQTKQTASDQGTLGFLLGAALVVASGGAALPALAAGAAGGLVGAGSVNQRDLDRFTSVLDEFLGGAVIEDLPAPFVTFHHQIVKTGVEPTSSRSGKVAVAVGKSVANPLIFANFDPTSKGFVDPGTDRMLAVPVEDACKLFPDARLIAINVTKYPAFFSAGARTNKARLVWASLTYRRGRQA